MTGKLDGIRRIRGVPPQQGRQQLVGLESGEAIPEGAMLVTHAPGAAEGHVTAGGIRALEAGAVALGLLRDGHTRLGEDLVAWSPTRRLSARVKVVPPMFYDAEGVRYRD